jgi:predicted O-linked N-acetylglucosamine transferase (SPINDLY family)
LICLGSFNDLSKITDDTLKLWAKLLRVLPQAKLLLKTAGLQDKANCERVTQQMIGMGVSNDRLELYGKNENWQDHMAMYDRLDIALDPVGGQGGATTTCEALWMGVPVISLAGQKVGQRMTPALVNALGHAEWIAHSESEYIEKTIKLALDVDHRQGLRKRQREKMAASEICDAKGLTKSLEAAYIEMHDRWSVAHARK